MDTQSIRERMLNAPEKQEDLEMPDWLKSILEPGTELAIKDVPGDEIGNLQKQAAKDPNANDVTSSAAIICRCLINKENGELIFQPADRDLVAKFGATKLKPLNEQITAFFGMAPGQKPIEDAKKN